ncbi:MAG: hypothetical protein V8S22_01595 [Lachnospiraceae bacterium]
MGIIFLIALFTGVVLYSTVVMKISHTAYFSCVVFVSITVMHITDESPLLFVLNRVFDTLLGVALGFAVNSFHLPRKKNKDVLYVSGLDDTLLGSGQKLSSDNKVELNRVIDLEGELSLPLHFFGHWHPSGNLWRGNTESYRLWQWMEQYFMT